MAFKKIVFRFSNLRIDFNIFWSSFILDIKKLKKPMHPDTHKRLRKQQHILKKKHIKKKKLGINDNCLVL